MGYVSMSNWKVLVVEDYDIAQKMIVLILEMLNCQVDKASDGKSAIELAKKNRYHLIFMDIGLPDMDGDRVVREIREYEASKPQLKVTPIVALTAHSEQSYRDRCAAVKVDDFLEKPLTLDTARLILEKFL